MGQKRRPEGERYPLPGRVDEGEPQCDHQATTCSEIGDKSSKLLRSTAIREVCVKKHGLGDHDGQRDVGYATAYKQRFHVPAPVSADDPRLEPGVQAHNRKIQNAREGHP